MLIGSRLTYRFALPPEQLVEQLNALANRRVQGRLKCHAEHKSVQFFDPPHRIIANGTIERFDNGQSRIHVDFPQSIRLMLMPFLAIALVWASRNYSQIIPLWMAVLIALTLIASALFERGRPRQRVESLLSHRELKPLDTKVGLGLD